MSNALAEKQPTDLTDKDMEKISNFIAEGKPGLARLAETDFDRMTKMYITGLTYGQISNILNIGRPLVTYMSHTYGWYPAKQEYLAELQEKIKGRVIDSKLNTQDFILLMIQAYQKKIGAKLQKYLATDDPAHADEIDLKEIDKLIKAIETLQSLSSDTKKSGSKTPALGLNVGDGVTIERDGDSKVTITPVMDKQLGSMLKKFADSRRAEQNVEKKSTKHDISDNQTPKEEKKDE